ncbi:unknown [Prevotella sp. CAG:1185]|nr:unknown [Prevotella sp. CAG:1185]
MFFIFFILLFFVCFNVDTESRFSIKIIVILLCSYFLVVFVLVMFLGHVLIVAFLIFIK